MIICARKVGASVWGKNLTASLVRTKMRGCWKVSEMTSWIARGILLNFLFYLYAFFWYRKELDCSSTLAKIKAFHLILMDSLSVSGFLARTFKMFTIWEGEEYKGVKQGRKTRGGGVKKKKKFLVIFKRNSSVLVFLLSAPFSLDPIIFSKWGPGF